jgi:primosomal protein N' (replication factor Y)
MTARSVDVPVARVIVDIPTRSLDSVFDYLVPERMAATVTVGTPLLVPFGPQRVVGYVAEMAESSEIVELKEPVAVLGEPLFTDVSVRVARWIADEYVSTVPDALRLFLPPGGVPSLTTRVRVADAARRPSRGRAAKVFDAVAAGEESARALEARFGRAAASDVSRLVSVGAVERTYELKRPQVSAVEERLVDLVVGADVSSLSPAATAMRAVMDALTGGPVTVGELAARLGTVSAAVKRLEEKGLVTVVSRRHWRDPSSKPRPAPRHETLSGGQQESLTAVAEAAPGDVVLLEGVTGSGKTEVYLRAIERVLAEGGGAIVLVPEISLTPQTVGRFRTRFGEQIAVLHSRLSAGERFDQWSLAASGDARVAIGPRSALFAPVRDLRLVVIDEEHEPSYKQGSAPRYHAREAAERLCRETGAVLVLGSATPSFESRVAAAQGRYRRVVLPQRVGGGTMPAITVVDMAKEFSEGHRSMFSRALLVGLGDVAAHRDKAVLFLNRRGFASFVLCRECGHVPSCPRCSVSLTFHEKGARLVCHHCGHEEALPAVCPVCASPFLRQFGAGTQRVEAELAAAFPDLRVVRMDADSTTGKGGHERALAAFEALDSGILLGTQMVAKGLDYPEVTLVGVINADTTLHLPDFRAGERTFQLLSQVAGRAGRGERAGTVVIQTYWPDHPSIRAAAACDADIFYAQERVERQSLRYPPFGRLANINVIGRDLAAVRDTASALAEALARSAPAGWEVLGPSASVLARVKEHHRWHVLLKAPAGAALSQVVRDAVAAVGPREDVSVAPDVDPLDLM